MSDDLSQRYADADLQELFELWQSGDLSRLAELTLEAEFAARGISVENIPAPPPTAQKIDKTALKQRQWRLALRGFTRMIVGPLIAVGLLLLANLIIF